MPIRRRFCDDVERLPLTDTKQRANPIFPPMSVRSVRARTRDSRSPDEPTALSTVRNSVLSRGGPSRFHRVGHFAACAHFRTCLALALQIALETEGNCEFCSAECTSALGGERYQVLRCFHCGPCQNFCELSDAPRPARLIALSTWTKRRRIKSK